MKRRVPILMAIAAAVLPAATLEQLSLDDMIRKSTVIVRGRVSGFYTDQRGAMIYTHYNVAVAEKLKGAIESRADIVLPGGAFRGLRQNFSGTPKLEEGAEYVLFVWTSKSGLHHVIGLSQGVFDVRMDAGGQVSALRAATAETMLDPASGKPVRDEDIRISLKDLRERITRVLGAAKE